MQKPNQVAAQINDGKISFFDDDDLCFLKSTNDGQGENSLGPGEKAKIDLMTT